MLYIALLLFAIGMILFFVFGATAQIGGGCGFDDLPFRLKVSIFCIVVSIVLIIIWAVWYFFAVFLA